MLDVNPVFIYYLLFYLPHNNYKKVKEKREREKEKWSGEET